MQCWPGRLPSGDHLCGSPTQACCEMPSGSVRFQHSAPASECMCGHGAAKCEPLTNFTSVVFLPWHYIKSAEAAPVLRRFWMTAESGKPSCHDALDGDWKPSSADTAAGRLPGFGTVTNIISGGLECGPHRSNTAGGPDRIGYFQLYATILSIATGNNLSCDASQPF